MTLPTHEVHVWRAWLDRPAPCVRRLLDVLSTDELRRADAFHFDRDRTRFIAGRGLLRVILGRYLQCPPRRLRFSYSAYGKPTLAQEPGRPRVQFNLSHSADCALYAVVQDREVGIDVEQVRNIPDADRIAGHVFSSNEYAHFLRLPRCGRQAAFLHGWTCKEAYIKALGQGLSHPLGRFDVSMDPSEPAALLRVQDVPEEVARWSLRKISPGAGYTGALAVEGSGHAFKCWRIP